MKMKKGTISKKLKKYEKYLVYGPNFPKKLII